jgi:hypothetical protein
MAATLAVLYWILEGLMRHQYWYKYVIRYRAIRDALNKQPAQIEQLSLYDLTHSYGRPKPSQGERLRRSFGKLEPIVLYTVLALGALLLWSLVRRGVVSLPANATGG